MQHQIGDLIFHCHISEDETQKFVGWIVQVLKFEGTNMNMYDTHWSNGDQRRFSSDVITMFKQQLQKELDECTK